MNCATTNAFFVNEMLSFRNGIIPFLVIYHSYVAQTVSLCPIPPHFVKFGNATSFFRIGIIPILNNYIPFATFVKYLKLVIWAIAALV